MEDQKKVKLYSLDDFIDEEIGVEGSIARDSFDDLVAEKVKANQAKESYHVTMPIALHDSVAQKAAQLGRSISDYISSIMARELGVAC